MCESECVWMLSWRYQKIENILLSVCYCLCYCCFVVCRLVTIASVYLRHLITLNCREKRARQESARDTVTYTQSLAQAKGRESGKRTYTQMSCRDWLDFVICVLCQFVQSIVVLLKINPIIIIEGKKQLAHTHEIVLFFSLRNRMMIKMRTTAENANKPKTCCTSNEPTSKLLDVWKIESKFQWKM